MIESTIFIAILLTLAASWIGMAFYSSRKITSTTDYFLAGKQLGVAPIALTLMATQIGGGFLSGIAQESYYTGFYGILYALGICAGFILLGLGVAQRLKALNISTTAELFETKYHSPLLRKIASALLIASLWGILVAQIVAFKTIAAGVGIGTWVTVVFWLAIIIHTMMGGLNAVVGVDMLKQVFIVTVFSGIFIYSFFTLDNPPFSWSALNHVQSFFAVPGQSMHELFALFLMPTLFCLIEQDLAQCFFAAQNSAIASRAAVYASIFLLCFSLAPVYFGMQTRLLNLEIAGDANPLIIFLSYIIRSDVIIACALFALIAAITSTANSLLCATSAHIAQDFVVRKNAKDTITISRTITLLTGGAALIASFLVDKNILGILTTSYELSVSCLFVSALIAYFKKEVKMEAAALSMLAGACGFVLFRYISVGIPKEIATLALSLCGYLIGWFLFSSAKNK